MTASHLSETPVLVTILGPVTIQGAEGFRPVPGKLDRAVLVHLALAEGRALSVEDLTEALWADQPPTKARNALQVKISRLRALLGRHAHRLEFTQGGYRLRLEADQIDVNCFTDALSRGEAALHEGNAFTALTEFERALSMWKGDPLFTELDEHPRIVAARLELADLLLTAREAHAEARLDDPAARQGALADLRALLENEPLRPRARRALMHGLDLSGRRAEALAVYDAGRRLFEENAGLEPPAELRREFDRLLAAERDAVRRVEVTCPPPRAAPETLAEAARWLADDGDPAGALQLAVRGAWWWWTCGDRGRARELFQELLGHADDTGSPAAAQLSAQAWHGVFGCNTADAEESLRNAEQALRRGQVRPWKRSDALAAALIAERLFERGERQRAGVLLRCATRQFVAAHDDWGEAVCGIVAARGHLQAGNLPRTEATAAASLTEFTEMEDHAGEVMALDVLGLCAEIHGNLVSADRIHRQALSKARNVGSPDWEASQLTRLGNVGTLANRPAAVDDLTRAVRLSNDICSGANTALSRNGLGVAHYLRGDQAAAAEEHRTAWHWYTKTNSRSGRAYTSARLALAYADDMPTATRWALDSLRLGLPTKDPRAIAHSLEAVGLVIDDAPAAARALAAAATLRTATGAPLPPPQLLPLEARREELVRIAGRQFSSAWKDGARDPVRLARSMAEA